MFYLSFFTWSETVFPNWEFYATHNFLLLKYGPMGYSAVFLNTKFPSEKCFKGWVYSHGYRLPLKLELDKTGKILPCYLHGSFTQWAGLAQRRELPDSAKALAKGMEVGKWESRGWKRLALSRQQRWEGLKNWLWLEETLSWELRGKEGFGLRSRHGRNEV